MTLPTGTAITNLANNVQVGLTWMDVLAGWLNIGITMVTDKLLRPKTGPAVPKNEWKTYFEKWVVPVTKKNWTNLAKKSAVALVTGATRIALTGEGSISVKIGTDYANVGLTYARTKDGGWSVAGSGQLGVPAAPGGVAAIAGKYDYKHNADGTTTRTATGSASEGLGVGPGGVAGKQTASSSTRTDANEHEKDTTTTSSQTVAAEPGIGHHETSTTTTKSEAGKPTKTEISNMEGGSVFGHNWGEPL